VGREAEIVHLDKDARGMIYGTKSTTWREQMSGG
jgi:hypothetical protein